MGKFDMSFDMQYLMVNLQKVVEPTAVLLICKMCVPFCKYGHIYYSDITHLYYKDRLYMIALEMHNSPSIWLSQKWDP